MSEIHRLAVVEAKVIDGIGHAPQEGVTVLIEGDRVVEIGPAGTTRAPVGATLIDGRGKFLIPGLVDMHVHVYTPEKWHPEFFLAAGVTTVLEMPNSDPPTATVEGLRVKQAIAARDAYVGL